jgi:hypothetical protein
MECQICHVERSVADVDVWLTVVVARRCTPRTTTRRITRNRPSFRPNPRSDVRPKSTTMSCCPGESRSFIPDSAATDGDRLTSGLSPIRVSLVDHLASTSGNRLLTLFVWNRFYFPMGRPNSKDQLESVVQRITNAFHQLANCQATREHFAPIAKVSVRVDDPARRVEGGADTVITVVCRIIGVRMPALLENDPVQRLRR